MRGITRVSSPHLTSGWASSIALINVVPLLGTPPICEQNQIATALHIGLTCPYILISFWRPFIHALLSPVQVEWQHPSAVYCVIEFRVRGCWDFHTESKPRPMIDIYRAFGFLIITIEWLVWLRNDFTGVILIHVDTFQPVFSKTGKITMPQWGPHN